MVNEEGKPKKAEFEEIEELLNIPKLETFFGDALRAVLRAAREEFKDEIRQYYLSKKKLETGNGDAASFYQKRLSKNKSYFFEFNRIENEGSETGYTWELEKFKLKNREGVVEMIFSGFRKRLDDYEVAPGLIKNEKINPEKAKKTFEINFMKSSDTRVVGFVKETERDADTYVLIGNPNMIKVATNYQNVDKEDMYSKLFQLMEEDPEVREEIFFYFYMLQKSIDQSSKPTLKG